MAGIARHIPGHVFRKNIRYLVVLSGVVHCAVSRLRPTAFQGVQGVRQRHIRRVQDP